jgi:hypothetical protein
MRRFLYIGFWVTVLGTLAFLILSRYDKVEHLEMRVTGNIQTDHVDQIWFSPAGEVVSTGLNGTELIVRVWSGSAGALVRERSVSLAANKPEKPVFAVSADASQAAWLDPAGVRVVSLIALEGESSAILQSGRRIPMSSLAFIGPGKLAALYQDGELDIWDIARDRVVATTHFDIAEPVLLISSVSYLAAYSSGSGHAFVFDTAGDRFLLLEHKQYPRDILSLTLSPQARFAVATRETIEQPGHSIRTPGPARGLAFLDRNRVLAGGDFQGIYILSPDRGPQQIVEAGAGVTVLAAAGFNLAFGNNSSLTIASGRMVRGSVYKGMSRPSPWLFIGFFGLVTPVLIYFSWDAIRVMLRKIFKLKAPLEEEPKLASEEGPIPNALIEACQNGDCVLWAGSGLGAQAGLPTWGAFLRELAEWATQNGLSPEGQSGVAADRIAAALEGREEALHAYLRRRFRVTSELSQAHRLIREIDFQGLVTTSLDNLLDRTFPYSGGRVYTAEKCEGMVKTAARRDFFLLKPYGDLDEPETIRIGPKQCAEIVAINTEFSDLMERLIETRVFLFIGASLEGLERDLAYLNLPAATKRKNYALISMDQEGWQAAAERLRERYAIEPLTYAPSTAQHPEMVEFLTKLHELIQQKTSTQGYREAAK